MTMAEIIQIFYGNEELQTVDLTTNFYPNMTILTVDHGAASRVPNLAMVKFFDQLPCGKFEVVMVSASPPPQLTLKANERIFVIIFQATAQN